MSFCVWYFVVTGFVWLYPMRTSLKAVSTALHIWSDIKYFLCYHCLKTLLVVWRENCSLDISTSFRNAGLTVWETAAWTLLSCRTAPWKMLSRSYKRLSCTRCWRVLVVIKQNIVHVSKCIQSNSMRWAFFLELELQVD